MKKNVYCALIISLFATSVVWAQEVELEENFNNSIPVEIEIQEQDILLTGEIVEQEQVPNEIQEQEILPKTEEVEEESVPSDLIPSGDVPPTQAEIQELELFSLEIENSTTTVEDITVTATTSTSTLEEIIDEVVLFADESEQELETDTVTNSVSIFIRNGERIVFDQNIELDETSSTVEVTDMTGASHLISGDSLLALLIKADQSDDTFAITKLQYYDSFGSFYLKCVEISGEEYCDFWQYLVNDSSPWTGIDQTAINEGDEIVLYFGAPYQVVFDTDVFTVDTSFNAIAQQYDYQTNTWSARTGVTLGVTVTNPDDIWTPIELITSPVDDKGVAQFTIATSGEYMIGVKDDWYYPVYTITVGTSTATTTDTATSTETGSSGSGSSSSKSFDVDAAIAFIKSLQDGSGSYGGNELYSDWVAVAFSAYGESDSRLRSYLRSKSPSSITTDNERRVMAILALGDDPYDFGGKNYVQAILNDFDGTQIGEKNLLNDDIFGVLVLSKVGYDEDDEEISKTIEFILSRQQSSGLWESSHDLTAAAVQALEQYSSVSGVSSALTKAKNALKNAQLSSGGWGDIYKSAWIAQAMYVLDENWTKNSNSVEDYFVDQQQEDGGVLDESESNKNRIWATSYVIPAVLEMSWNDILIEVGKPETVSASESDTRGGGSSDSGDETVTSTDESIAEEVTDDSENLTATSTLAFETRAVENTPIAFAQTEFIQEGVEEIDASSTDETKDEVFDSQNLAAVNQIPWFREWWTMVLGGVLLLGFGLRFVFKK